MYNLMYLGHLVFLSSVLQRGEYQFNLIKYLKYTSYDVYF